MPQTKDRTLTRRAYTVTVTLKGTATMYVPVDEEIGEDDEAELTSYAGVVMDVSDFDVDESEDFEVFAVKRDESFDDYE